MTEDDLIEKTLDFVHQNRSMLGTPTTQFNGTINGKEVLILFLALQTEIWDN